MWTALAAYASLATSAVANALWVSQGPWWERLLIGVARLPFSAQAILLLSGATVLGSWWILGEEERKSLAGDGADAPSPLPAGE